MKTKHYGAIIKSVDSRSNETVFLLSDGSEYRIGTSHQFWCEGQRGTLVIDDVGPGFSPYAEQRLRKVGELAPAQTQKGNVGQFIWQIDGQEAKIFTRAGFVPGIDGRFIPENTQPLQLAVPSEFTDLCESRGLVAQEVLEGFIADLCGLMSYMVCPREDGYSSNGSDERELASEWFDRAYPDWNDSGVKS